MDPVHRKTIAANLEALTRVTAWNEVLELELLNRRVFNITMMERIKVNVYLSVPQSSIFQKVKIMLKDSPEHHSAI